MKVNEIRVGNLVQTDYEGTLEIVNINSEGFGFVDVRKHPFKAIGRHEIDYLQPIPLTEEWLIKFGFEAANIYSNFKFQDIEISSSVRVITTNVRSNFYLDGEMPEWMKIRLYYVHQLQNLYFALTNEELTITQ